MKNKIQIIDKIEELRENQRTCDKKHYARYSAQECILEWVLRGC